MVASTVAPVVTPTAEAQKEGFLAILPRIETHARIYFRHVACPGQKEEAVAETIALSWLWYVSLLRRGKDAQAFPSTLASYAARAVRFGRRVCGTEKAKDVMLGVAQRRHGFTVGKLPDRSTLASSALSDALTDNVRTPPSEQAAFRVDFPGWRTSYAQRDRDVIDNLLMGERTKDVSRKFGLSPARISQKRRQFHQDWLAFHGELGPQCQGDGAV